MPSMVEMCEAHLMNVQREMQTLSERKATIDQDLVRLDAYLKEGVAELDRTKAKEAYQIEAQAKPQSTIFDPAIHGGQQP